MCLLQYKLDPAHYISLPSLSWDAMLLFTKVELDVIKDPEMHLMIENGVRGGYSGIHHRYSSANNKYVPESFNSNLPTKFITYLDANNL